ncbi:MAG: VOC family protein [Hyphomonadaceae bacterium]|nr:VOC family protein [Hyphomonadaceae bacterium]
MQDGVTPFHVAFPVHDLAAARLFYGETLGCREGRSTGEWIDFDLYGHQVVAHHTDAPIERNHHGSVDGKRVPIPHFGVVLRWNEFEALAARLRAREVKFEIEPHIRFQGQAGEQATMFFFDPSGNPLEFKAFRDMASLFATDD